MAPLDEALGVLPYQRISEELQALGCALAVFVLFATAARFLGWYYGSVVRPRAVWRWVQTAGRQAMAPCRLTWTLSPQGATCCPSR